MRSLLRVVCVVLLTLCVVAPSFVSKGASENEIEAVPTSEMTESGERITRFLVMGRDRAAGLTDSIFVVALNETARRASILQIPRDTFANYTEKRYKKLNGALNEMGERGVKELLSSALGVRLDYFVILDLSCLRQTVNAIGGVEVEIPQDMEYSDPAQGLEIHLSAGTHRLTGDEAEQFVRYRAGYVNADLGRLDAQKIFLKAFAKQCQSVSPTRLLQAACMMLNRVQTDIGLPEAIRVVSVLRECDTDDIPMETVAGEAVQGRSGAWYYCINRAGACRTVNEYLMPRRELTISEFDPNGLFDQTQNRDFHKIYIAPDLALPSEYIAKERNLLKWKN